MQRQIAGLIGVALWVLGLAGCGGGSSAFHEGEKAELRKDYDTAFVDFSKAVQSQPDNSLYLIHQRAAGTEASAFHVRQGKRLLEAGKRADAAGEFQKALSIDPTNQAAGQELQIIVAADAEAKKAREKELQNALKPEEAAPEAPKLKPFPKEPIVHIRISGVDSRKAFETLGKLGDLNVAFTADFQPRPISLDLTAVKLDDALRILSFQTRTFWKPITSNTILVIPDNAANHRDFDEQVVRTVFLTNPIPDADRTQITGALKQLLNIQRIIDNKIANAIIISDTQAKVDAAERLIHDLDRGKAEILVQVAIMEADRNYIRDLGLEQIPTTPLSGANIAGIGFTPPGTTTTTTDGSTTTTTAGLPLNQLGKLSTSDFSIALPGIVANALLNDTHSHILQNPEIRTTDGQKATLNIGSRVPFATGSFLPSFGGATGGGTGAGGFGLLASTQFQYQDVGVKLEITPRVLSDGEVALHAKIEISAVGPSVTIGGLSQPTFTQKTIEHDIRLKEGEANLLGGLDESDTSQGVTGLPGLSQIPILRYFFSSEHREFTTTEVLVMLTPRVVRLPDPRASQSAQVTVGSGGAGPAIDMQRPMVDVPLNLPQPPGDIPQ